MDSLFLVEFLLTGALNPKGKVMYSGLVLQSTEVLSLTYGYKWSF